ncbi:MAG: tRNA 2-thiouridine(34) synthase MnmA [Bacteroidetes bacterium]|nr:tRNA 2-thiouridine(34) synthase MnmA [Bacteroidota bacterium]
MNIAALVSGGVDSSAIVHLLKEEGFTPTLFYIIITMEDEDGFWDCSYKEDIDIVMKIARQYGLKMEVLSLHKEYWEQVISYHIESVKKGLTPNPDMMCNKLIKFGTFDEKYGKDFDKIASGHYAATSEINNQIYLSTAKDKIKDQTYFLGQISHSQLNRLMFPLGDLQKSEVRKLAARAKLPSADRPDSQGICFLGKINYRDFLNRFLGEKEGDIVEIESGKILGKHKGFWYHTIGQRQGLGLSLGPWFVIRKDAGENIVYVSHGYDPEAQYENRIYLKEFNYINPAVDLFNTSEIKFKIRHTPDFSPGHLRTVNDVHLIESDLKISGVAPGQFGVIYDQQEKICLGSGVIINPPS